MGLFRLGLLLIGAAMLGFSVMSFSPAGRDSLGVYSGVSYDITAKIGAAIGSALIVGGLLLNRKPR